MTTIVKLAIILFGLWFFSFFIFHIAGFLIHLLLVVAIIMILVRIIQGKNPLK